MDNNVVEKEQVAQQRPARQVMRKKKKVCAFCQDKVGHIDYKDTARLRKLTKLLLREFFTRTTLHTKRASSHLCITKWRKPIKKSYV